MLYRDNNIDRISNKESMRRSHHNEGWDMKMYDQVPDYIQMEKTLSGFCGNPAKTNFCPNCGADMREES